MAAPNEHAARAKGSGWVPELEGLRGVLAWTVVVSHILICSGWFGPMFGRARVLNDISESAVDVFMLLSGFAITRLLAVQRESYGSYLTRRAFRIFPAYWAALALGILCNGWLAENFRRLGASPDAAAYAQICDVGAARGWLDVSLHALLFQGLTPASVLPYEPYTFLGVAWSLSLEWQFYLLAPLVLWFAVRRRSNALILAILTAIAALFSARITASFSNAFLPAKAALFFVGAITYFEVEKNRQSRSSVRWLFISCLLLIFFRQLGSGRVIESWLPALIWFCTLSAAHVGWLPGWKRFLVSAPLQFLGRISYSTYLWHVPLIAVLQTAIWKWQPPKNESELLCWTALCALPATLFVSWISWRLIERPFQRLGLTVAR